MVVQWVTFVASQFQGLWFYPELGLLSVWSFKCSPCVCVGFLRVQQFASTSKNMLLVYWLQWTGH